MIKMKFTEENVCTLKRLRGEVIRKSESLEKRLFGAEAIYLVF